MGCTMLYTTSVCRFYSIAEQVLQGTLYKEMFPGSNRWFVVFGWWGLGLRAAGLDEPPSRKPCSI